MKRLLSGFLLAALLMTPFFAFSEGSFAEELETPVLEDDIDEDWEVDHWEPVYTYLDNSQHMVEWHIVFINGLGQYMMNPHIERTDYESHSVSFSYTGQNYHSGSRHYFQYGGTCTKCGSYITNWQSGSCPGNGNCIEPLVNPDLPV